jgi:hypothetical protein
MRAGRVVLIAAAVVEFPGAVPLLGATALERGHAD